MKKATVTVGLVAALLMGSVVFGADTTINMTRRPEVSIEANGHLVEAEPLFRSDTTYLPLRKVAEMLGVTVDWSGETNQIKLTAGEETTTPERETITGLVTSLLLDDKGYYHVYIKGEGTVLDELVAIVSGKTTIANKAGDVELYAPDLQVGMKVTVYYGPATTMSLPAQSAALHLIIEASAPLTLEDRVKTGIAGDVTYPVVFDHVHADQINALLEREATALAEASYFEELVASFRITRIDDRVLSGVFNGTALSGSRNQSIARPFSIDLTSGEVITFDSAVRDEEGLRTLIGEQVVSRGLVDVFEAEGIWLYFEGERVVFQYYPLDDSVDRPVVIDLPMEAVDPYLIENNW